ncbi:MAG: galactokinase [Spirochaetota bacterium]
MGRSIQELHTEEYGERPEIAISVPGVITLMGEYSDLCDGYALCGAVDRTTEIAISRRTDNSLRFYAADLGERKRTTIPNLKYRKEDRWANYIKGVLYETYRRNYLFKGLNITIYCDIPQKMGLRASTAICTSAALALKEMYNFNIEDNQLIQSVYFAETSFLQSKSRLVDIMTMLHAKAGNVMLFDLHSFEYTQIPLNMEPNHFVITESNVPSFSVREDIVYREEKTQEGLAYLKDKLSSVVMRDISLSDAATAAAQLPEEQKRFSLYVLEESLRVKEASRALEQKDPIAYGRCMNRSQRGLRDKFEVSCPEIDWLTKRALELPGCYGSNLVGPGFGGSTLTLISPKAMAGYHERLEEYEHIFGFHPEVITYEPRGKAVVL